MEEAAVGGRAEEVVGRVEAEEVVDMAAGVVDGKAAEEAADLEEVDLAEANQPSSRSFI